MYNFRMTILVLWTMVAMAHCASSQVHQRNDFVRAQNALLIVDMEEKTAKSIILESARPSDTLISFETIAEASRNAADVLCAYININKISGADSQEFKTALAKQFAPWFQKHNVDLMSLENAWTDSVLEATPQCALIQDRSLLSALRDLVKSARKGLDSKDGSDRFALLSKYSSDNLNDLQTSRVAVQSKLNNLEQDVDKASATESKIDFVIWSATAVGGAVGVAATATAATAGQVFAAIGLGAQIWRKFLTATGQDYTTLYGTLTAGREMHSTLSAQISKSQALLKKTQYIVMNGSVDEAPSFEELVSSLEHDTSNYQQQVFHAMAQKRKELHTEQMKKLFANYAADIKPYTDQLAQSAQNLKKIEQERKQKKEKVARDFLKNLGVTVPQP